VQLCAIQKKFKTGGILGDMDAEEKRLFLDRGSPNKK
jgi:hypothetical protein